MNNHATIGLDLGSRKHDAVAEDGSGRVLIGKWAIPVAQRTQVVNCIRGMCKVEAVPLWKCAVSRIQRAAEGLVPEGLWDRVCPLLDLFVRLDETIGAYDGLIRDYSEEYVNAAFPISKELAVEIVCPEDEVTAVTGRVFVAQSPERFTYDADGNMTCDGRFRYTWNAENRLVRAQELVAPTNRHPYTVSYAYDHKGRMVSKRITENDGHDSLVKSVSYLWDGWNIIREIQWPVASGQWSVETLATSHYPLVTDYVWGLDIDGTLQGAGGVGGLLAVVRDDGVFLPTYEANGNVSEYVSTNGSIVAHYDYSPFGETLIESGDLASTFTHRFSTKPWCPVTGLYEYQMRKYRPEIGRWLSRDPIGEHSGANLLLFLANMPLFLFDKFGLMYEEASESFFVKEVLDGQFVYDELSNVSYSLNFSNKRITENKGTFTVAAKIEGSNKFLAAVFGGQADVSHSYSSSSQAERAFTSSFSFNYRILEKKRKVRVWTMEWDVYYTNEVLFGQEENLKPCARGDIDLGVDKFKRSYMCMTWRRKCGRISTLRPTGKYIDIGQESTGEYKLEGSVQGEGTDMNALIRHAEKSAAQRALLWSRQGR